MTILRDFRSAALPVSLAFVLAPVLSLALALALTLAGCTGDASPESVLLSTAGTSHEAILGWRQQSEEPVRLATQGPIDVDAELFAGDVRIEVDGSLSETVVSMRRVGAHGWGRTDEAMKSLGDIRTIVSFERRDGVDAVVARATTQHPEPHFQRADLLVRTPDLGSVRVRTSRAGVWVSGNRGPVDIETTRGRVRVMTPWRMDQPMTIVTSDETIDLRIRGESRGWFDAQSVNGAVKADVKFGEWLVMDERNDAHSLRAWLNGGTNPIVLRTSNATIHIRVVPQPISTNPFTPVP